MTYAPRTLLDLAAYWKANGGVNLGIVGDAPHVSGGTSYHLGADQLADGAYSATLPRDVAGLTNAASAIDLGRLDGSLANLQAFSRHLVSWCLAGAPGSRDIREIIYSPNGKLPIHRYSALDKRVYTGIGSGDSSHLWHTHISYWRDSEKRDKREPFRAYFEDLPDTGTGGPIAVPGLEVRNPRPWAGTVVVKDQGTLAARNHDRQGIPLIPGPPGKAAAAIAYVPKQPLAGYTNVDFEGEAYFVGDVGAWILARNVNAIPAPVPGVDDAYNAGLNDAGGAVAAVPRR